MRFSDLEYITMQDLERLRIKNYDNPIIIIKIKIKNYINSLKK